MHFIEVGFETRIVVAAIRQGKQLVEVWCPEVVHVLSPAHRLKVVPALAGG